MNLQLGQPTQLGYVVRDLDTAINHWTTALGVGPWYVFDPLELSGFEYRGQSSDPDIQVALANSGSLQIELIHQRNNAPSMYVDFLAAGHEGLQHISWWPDDYDATYQRIAGSGLSVGQQGNAGNIRFAYFDTMGEPGTVIEIADLDDQTRSFFTHIGGQCANWDGSTNPVHRVT